MLHTITWAQFGAVILLGLVIYYGYVLIRYYGRELRAFAQGKKVGSDGKGHPGHADIISHGPLLQGAGSGSAGSRGAGTGSSAGGPAVQGPAAGQVPVPAGHGQGTIFPGPGTGDNTPELFKVMEKAIVLLRQVVAEASAAGVRREELEDRIRTVLSGYRQLVKTPYQVSINNFIARTCTTNFSLMLSDAEIAALWSA
jgi:hypothetical protein